jgi:predicted O-methyltransferase YrrM
MKRTLLVGVIILAIAAAGLAQRRGPGPGGFGRGGYTDTSNPPLPKSDAEKRILSTQEQMVKAGEMFSNVPMNDGRMLRLLTEAMGAKSVVEIGTSTGYSGLWFCTALQNTGGKLTTFEIDPGLAALARKHFQQAGVDSMVTIVEGDAHQTVAKLKGPVDIVFIDADKEGYLDYLNKLLPLVRPGGLILAHNVDTAPDYVRAVTTNPDLETTFFSLGNGLGITLKKR